MSLIQYSLGTPNKKCPRWAAVGFCDEEKLEVYLPAAVAPASELEVVLMLGQDGVSYVQKYGHVYVPISWLEREYPKHNDTWAHVKKRVIEAVKSSSPA
jgi:hypothetical protein